MFPTISPELAAYTTAAENEVCVLGYFASKHRTRGCTELKESQESLGRYFKLADVPTEECEGRRMLTSIQEKSGGR